MTGDRRLNTQEKKLFIAHGSIGIEAVTEAFFQGDEPSLYDAAFLEILGKLSAHTQTLINLATRVSLIEKTLAESG